MCAILNSSDTLRSGPPVVDCDLNINKKRIPFLPQIKYDKKKKKIFKVTMFQNRKNIL